MPRLRVSIVRCSERFAACCRRAWQPRSSPPWRPASHRNRRSRRISQSSARRSTWCASTSRSRDGTTSRSPTCRPPTSSSPRTMRRRPWRRSSSSGSTGSVARIPESRSRFAARRRPRSRRPRTTSGCSPSSWTTTTSTGTRRSRFRSGSALEGFVEQLQPTDLVVLMDPLTTLDSLRYTRNKAELLERIRDVRGPARRAVPGAERRRGSADDAAERLRAAGGGVAVGARGHHHAPRRASRGPQVRAVRQPGPAGRDARQHQLPAPRGGAPGRQSRQRHRPRPRSAAARFGAVRRGRGAAPAVDRDRRPRHRQHQQPRERD